MIAEIRKYVLRNWSDLLPEERAPKSVSFLLIPGGATRIAKINILIFRDAADAAVLCAKLPRFREANAWISRQHEILSALHRAGSPWLRASIPRTLGTTTIAGHKVLFQTAVPGCHMLQELDRTARGKIPAVTASHFDRLAAHLGRYYREVGLESRPLSAEALREKLVSPVERFLETFPLRGVRTRKYLEQLVERFSGLKDTTLSLSRIHGDLFPSNVFVEGRKTYLIDWEFSEPDSPPSLDAFKFVFYYLVHLMKKGAAPGQAGTNPGWMVLVNALLGNTWFSAAAGKLFSALGRDLGLEKPDRFEWLVLCLILETWNQKRHSLNSEEDAAGVVNCLESIIEYRADEPLERVFWKNLAPAPPGKRR